jgi:2-dehydro-3-deoxygluconokinase
VGDLIARELRAEGVTARIVVDARAQTGLMIKTRPWSDTSRVEYFRAGSAGSRLTPSDIEPNVVREARVLHVSGITPALSASAAAAVDHAIDLAVESGVPVSFDINYRSRLWEPGPARASYLQVARRATILFAGVDEAALLVTGSTPEELAQALVELGPSQVVVKLGAEGSVAIIDGELFRTPAIPITPVDTVGAGDAFAAGYLAELIAGADAGTRLATATRAGAFACLAHGDWEGFPRRSELDAFDSTDPVIR